MDEQFTEEKFEEVDMKKEIQYCLTEIPDIDFKEFLDKLDDTPFSQEFWDKVAETIRKENKQYEEQCKRMQIDPVSGKSTMNYEQMNKRFTI